MEPVPDAGPPQVGAVPLTPLAEGKIGSGHDASGLEAQEEDAVEEPLMAHGGELRIESEHLHPVDPETQEEGLPLGGRRKQGRARPGLEMKARGLGEQGDQDLQPKPPGVRLERADELAMPSVKAVESAQGYEKGPLHR